MKNLSSHLSPYRWNILLAVLAMGISAGSDLGLPLLLAQIVNVGLYQDDLAVVLRLGGWMLALALLGGGFALLNSYLSAQISANVGRTLRAEIFDKVESFSPAESSMFGTASLITRSTNDVVQIQNYLLALLRVVVRAPILAVGGLVLSIGTSPTLSLVLCVSLPLLAFSVSLVAKKGLPLSTSMQERLDRVTLIMREKLTGVWVIRAFGNEEYEQKRFDRASRDLTGTAIRMNRVMTLLFPISNLIMGGTVTAIVWFGAPMAGSGSLLVGDIIVIVQYVTQILMSIMMISMVFAMLPRAVTSAVRINEVLDAPEVITDPSAPRRGAARGELAFEDVSFTYPGAEEPALSHISFTSHAGETTAIIGSTGSGKSSLLNLILRFYDVTGGRILVDGVDVREYSQQELRGKIGYVPQRAVLFSGSIAENLRLGREDASDSELSRAVSIAQADEFVNRREGGLEAELSQGGANLSGGQKQRLSIARAVARRPEIYLFDDSFSALDFTTDAKLRAALSGETKDATVLIVAQRVSTIRHADRILVLDGGEQVGLGTHRELLKSCPVYREIAESQLSQKEIDYE